MGVSSGSSATAPCRSIEIEGLFDLAALGAFEWRGPGDERSLVGEEVDLMQAATPARRREFAAGRECARAALGSIGKPHASIGIGTRREPLWPAGTVGSISHTSDYCVAVAARVEPALDVAVGIDAEISGAVPPSLYQVVFTEAEQNTLWDAGEDERALWSTLMFSAKEAFYKAQYQLTKAWVGFKEVNATIGTEHLTLSPSEATDTLRAVRWPVRARFVIDNRLVVVGVPVESSATAG